MYCVYRKAGRVWVEVDMRGPVGFVVSPEWAERLMRNWGVGSLVSDGG